MLLRFVQVAEENGGGPFCKLGNYQGVILNVFVLLAKLTMFRVLTTVLSVMELPILKYTACNCIAGH